jgi:biopolymer transport protein ExbD
MATINVDSGRGGKKAVDSDIPLIPFIDLLLCCVMFLLVTAVWNQLASIDAAQNVPGQNTPDVSNVDELRLTLQLTGDGYVLASTAGDQIAIPKVGDAYDVSGLRSRLAAYHTAAPSRKDLTVTADDGIEYADLVQAMDAAVAAGFPGISVTGS